MAPALTLAVNRYRWLDPLIHGEVTSDRLDLTVLAVTDDAARHARALDDAYDAVEFSIGTYLAGWPDWSYTSIPAFPRRFTPHSRTLVNAEAGIETPADLAGRRVGLISWQNTLALWAKGVFADRYDLDLDAVDWYVTQDEPVPMTLPTPVEPFDRAAGPAMLAAGDLDALVLPGAAELYPPPDGTARLFEDLRSAETAYYEATGFYPVMHNVVVSNELLEEHPWVAGELLTTFRRSVEAFEEDARRAERQPLVWWLDYRQRERERFGDLWSRSFELEANAAELETMVRYATEQGLLTDDVDVATLFVE